MSLGSIEERFIENMKILSIVKKKKLHKVTKHLELGIRHPLIAYIQRI